MDTNEDQFVVNDSADYRNESKGEARQRTEDFSRRMRQAATGLCQVGGSIGRSGVKTPQ
jgi:hypothetical protein